MSRQIPGKRNNLRVHEITTHLVEIIQHLPRRLLGALAHEVLPRIAEVRGAQA